MFYVAPVGIDYHVHVEDSVGLVGSMPDTTGERRHLAAKEGRCIGQ